MITNLKCYTCDDFLSRRDTFYLYQCNVCFQKTPYCSRCNRTMDSLLNGMFFKCCMCKVLTKIVNRESVSPDHDIVHNITNSPNEYINLFQQNINVNNNTPLKNLFAGEQNVNRFNMNNIQQPIMTNTGNFNNNKIPLNQNLLNNFNQNETPCRLDDILQTPRNTSKIDRNLLFSPEDQILQTPLSVRNNTEYVINLKNLGQGFSTPRSLNRNIIANSQRNANVNRNILEEGITVDDFDNKLLLQSNSKNQENHNFSLLATKTRIGRIMSGKMDSNNLPINRGNNNNNNELFVDPKKTSIFAGYNKEEPTRNISKSPINLRKKKPTLTLPEQHLSVFASNSNVQNISDNKFGMSSNQVPGFGASSYLSDIKPINNYNTKMDSTKVSFTSYNQNNLLRLSNTFHN